jgi:hypothetical protein
MSYTTLARKKENLMIQPNFLGIGFPRAGTTYLWSVLRQHPQVFLPKNKELDFFTTLPPLNKIKENAGLLSRLYSNPSFINSRKYFNHFFKECNSDKIAVGEITPAYIAPHQASYDISSEDIALYIRQVLGGKIKLIANLRSPAQQIFSVFKFRLKVAALETLDDAIPIQIPNLKKNFYIQRKIASQYQFSEGIKAYLKHFKRKNFFFVSYEKDILDKSKNKDFFDNLCLFLGIDAFSAEAFTPFNEIINALDMNIIIPEKEMVVPTTEHGRGEDDPKSFTLQRGQFLIKTGWFPWDSIITLQSPQQLERIRLIKEQIEYGMPRDLEREINRFYYWDDIKQTEALTGLDLSYWYD